MPSSPTPPDPGPGSPRARLAWAVELAGRYGGPGSQSAGEPVFTELPALADALAVAAREGDREQVALALHLADVLGAAWERADPEAGRTGLDAVLVAAGRVGLRNELSVARVLRRRARLAMALGRHQEADEDLQRASAIAQDTELAVPLALDRVDLAMHRDDWDRAAQLVPGLLELTQATGDPLLQAMGLNRSAWCAFGLGDHALSQARYERAMGLAELHEDPAVEGRTAAGLGLLAMLAGETAQAALCWRRALELAEQLHDRGFTLHCLDGIAALLVLSERDGQGARLSAAVTASRQALGHSRPQALVALHEMVHRHAVEPASGWSYAEAVAFARAAVSDGSDGS